MREAKPPNLSDLIGNFEEFVNQISWIAEEARSENFSQEACKNILDRFYTEGWDMNYSQDDSFFLKGDRLLAIEKMLTTEQDSQSRKKLDELKGKLWMILPDFYLTHKTPGYTYLKTPEDYNPNNPYPDQDI